MANAPLDENNRAGMTALLNTNGTTIVRIKADPTNHGVKISDASTGSDNGGNRGVPDENSVGTLFVQSSAGDGALVSLYADSDGNLLIDSN